MYQFVLISNTIILHSNSFWTFSQKHSKEKQNPMPIFIKYPTPPHPPPIENSTCTPVEISVDLYTY